MITENLSTLKIHKLTQEQYDRELAAGNIDETALYLTPEEEIDLSGYATKPEFDTHVADTTKHIPSGGTSGQILKWSANGTAVWEDNNSMTCNVVESLPSTGINGALYVIK